MYLLGAAGMGAWGFVFFALLDTRSFGVILVATTVGLVLHGAMYGPQAAFFAELFGTRVRYSGASIGYQLASILAGGLAPLIAVALLDAWGSTLPVSLYLLGMCLLTIVAVTLAKETRGVSLTGETGVVSASATPPGEEVRVPQ
ncbi:hypothetical protein SAMN05421810_101489 [Amycolatopsis arida]|uniref:Major Facilitator Superfamily protein n=1 Tax=Amycolatopsis arida TaxID=587909 RepID=A0A1I5LC54_9PSEU|nr:hypothetical protein CLV69_104122 [Amycolatopsis arida]SFO94827.1 hypothetical protein SAMN05421810_101489 [Amycolatopsis arida]